MRPITLLAATALSATTVTAFLVVPNVNLPRKGLQQAMAPQDLGPQIPQPQEPQPPSNSGSSGSDLTISDILPTQRQINIFAGLTRDVEVLTQRLESSLGSNTTLLAPLNSAMKNLPRKPWEDRPDDTGVSAASSEDKAARNLRRFVLEHAVGVSPWLEGQKARTLWDESEGKDREIWWERRGRGSDGKEERKVIMPNEVVVEGVVGRVGNGEIWSLKGVVNYE